MSKSIPDAYKELHNQLSEIEGLRSKPEFPVEESNAWPYLEMGPMSGKWENLTMLQPIGEHKFPFKIHVLRGEDLPRAKEKLLPFPERVVNKLMYDNKTLNNTVSGVASLTWKEAPDKVGATDTIAVEFELTVQIYAGQSDF